MRDLGPILPHALVGLAAAALGPHIYLFGGDGPAGFTGAVQVFTPGTAAAAPAVSTVANLPVALHDGAAAAAGGALWFCGGGQSVGTSSIYRWRPGGTPVAVAGLGQPMSDMAGVTVNGHGLCLGGWTGAAYSAAVFEPAGARPQGTAPVVGQLVHAVRYAGASPLAGGVLVAGGRLASGQPTDLLQWMAPSPYEVGAFVAARDVGRLPQPLAYVMAAPLDGQVLVIGGVGPGGASAEIWDIAAPGARPRAVGQLPAGLSYGAAATLGGTVYVFGGNLSGTPSDQVLAITADT